MNERSSEILPSADAGGDVPERDAPTVERGGTLKEKTIGKAGAGLLALLGATWRWNHLPSGADSNSFASVVSENTPRIMLGWHCQQLLIQAAVNRFRAEGWRKQITALISRSSDGRMVAEAMRVLGYSSIAGSSSRGGTDALYSLSRALRAGGDVFITPDGPKGPPYVAKIGACLVSRRSGFPIIPVVARGDREWRFRSWDRLILGKPWMRGLFVSGPLIYPEGYRSLKEYVAAVQKILEDLNARVSAELGIPDERDQSGSQNTQAAASVLPLGGRV